MQANEFSYWLSQFELGNVLFTVKDILADTSFKNLSLSNNKTMETITREQREASG